MGRFFRLYLRAGWSGFVSVPIVAAVVTAGAALTGVPQGGEGLFRTYFGSLSMVNLLFAFLYCYSVCIVYWDLALSFGAARRELFSGFQAVLLAYGGLCCAVQAVVKALPGLFSWAEAERWERMLSLAGMPWWLYLLCCLTAGALGGVCGRLYARSRVWGTVILTSVLVGLVAGIVGLMLISLTVGLLEAPWAAPAGAALTGAVLLACLAVCELILHRAAEGLTVR